MSKEWSKFDERELLEMQLLGEARGEPIEAQIGVACVARNRVKSPVTWWGKNYRAVLTKPRQFSCFNPGGPNRQKILSIVRGHSVVVRQASWLANGVYWGMLKDPTKGPPTTTTPVSGLLRGPRR